MPNAEHRKYESQGDGRNMLNERVKQIGDRRTSKEDSKRGFQPYTLMVRNLNNFTGFSK